MNSSNNDRLYRWIAERTGLAVPLLERPSFAEQIRDRMSYWQLASESEYVDLLRNRPEELERIIATVAVPETWLFRYPDSFTYLADHLRRHAASHGPSRLRLLSVACATGEEAYSLAITAAYAGWRPDLVNVDGMDCQASAIAQAEQRTYDVRSLRHDLPHWAHRWLSIEGDRVSVDAAVADTVRFRHADILRTPSSGALYDAIFCRNLLIYFNESAREQVVRRLRNWLVPDGLLFLGHAERTDYVSELFRRIDAPHAFAWRRRTDVDAVGAAPRNDTEPLVKQAAARVPSVPLRATSSQDVAAASGSRDDLPGATNPSPSVVKTTKKTDVPTGSFEPMGADTFSVLELAKVRADSGDLAGALGLVKRHLEESRSGSSTSTRQLSPGEPREPEIRRRGDRITGRLAAQQATEAYQLMGTIYTALQEIDEAREAFEKVVYLQPNHEDALLQLAMICERQGHLDKADRYRRRAARAHQHTQTQSPISPD